MRRRKNFLPTLVMALFFWFFWLYVVFFTSPQDTTQFPIFLFFLTLALSLTLTFSLILANTRRGLLTTLAIIGFLLLRMYRLAHYLNLVLLIGILSSLELYLTKK